MIEIAIYRKIYLLPEKADELTPQVIQAIAEVYFKPIKFYEKLHHILIHGLGMKLKWFGTDYDFVSMQLADAGVYRSMMWMIEAPFCTNNYFEKIKVGFDTFYGPEKEMDNLVFGEWLIADEIFNEWVRTENPDLLNKLTGILFRKKSFWMTKKSKSYVDDLRLPFKEALIDTLYQENGAKMPEWVKYYCALWWYSCMADIRNRYTELYSNDEASEESNSSTLNLIQAMAGEVFGLAEKVEVTNVHKCLTYLDNKIKQQNKPADGVRTY